MKANLLEEHKAFIEKLRENYRVPPATKPTLRTTRVRSNQFFADQMLAVSASSANAFASAIGASGETMSRMQRAGRLTFSRVGHPTTRRLPLDAGADFNIAQGTIRAVTRAQSELSPSFRKSSRVPATRRLLRLAASVIDVTWPPL